jgi:hypothetical protein
MLQWREPLVAIQRARHCWCTSLLQAHGDGSSRLSGAASASSKQM